MNADDWFFAARIAATSALQRSGEPATTLSLRDGRFDDRHPWASFALPDTSDVVWVAQVDRSAPDGSLVVSSEWGDMGVWRHPNDPALPGLRVAVTPGALHRTLTSIAPSVDAHRVEIVALQPLKRATARIGIPGQAVYVKVLPPRRLDRVAHNHRRAHQQGVPSPTVLHVDDEHGLLYLSEIPGTSLADHLERGRVLPSAVEVWHLIDTITATLGTHGDLHDRQIVLHESGRVSGVVDLDDAGEGDLVDDLGRLIAHVAMRADTHPAERDRIFEFVQDLVTTSVRRVDAAALSASTQRSARRLQNLRRAGTRRLES